MSSRALRKLQREREEREEAATRKEGKEEPASEEDETPPLKPKVLNAFDMLNATDEEDDEDSGDEHDQDGVEDAKREVPEPQEQHVPTPKPKKSKKKRRGKGKGKAVEQQADVAQPQQKDDAGLDEIDLALNSLSAKDKQISGAPTGPTIDEANAQLHRLLAVEAKHLNALNEMKRLFGNVVLEGNEGGAASPRRRGRGPQTVDLGGALTARHSPISKGQGLKGLQLKRNPLMMGKEEWPQATSQGLGMEKVEALKDGTIEYRFVHSGIYQGVQREFEGCVASMDPQRLITMLIYNPYHISTLLQVSEIAKQQGDHSVSGDLLERALFTFGRSVHSSFTHALSEGKARLDFRRPENREFWLASWRYVKDLGQRGTWRTAYEWAKLILSLDPEGDPYCISRIIDQLALRGGQSEHLFQLAESSFFSDLWKDMPNIAISKTLAQHKLKQAQACRTALSQAINTYPWIIARLFQELNLSHLPKSIWGKTPRTDRETFDTESYVLNAKDIWAPPDAISLLVEVADTSNSSPTLPPPNNHPITLDEARSTLLTGSGPLINLLPRDFTTRPTTSSDPLPPEDDLPSYDPISTLQPTDPEIERAYADLPPNTPPADDAAAPQGPSTLTSFLSRMIPWLTRAAASEPSITRTAQEAGVDPAELAARHERFQDLSERLEELPDERPLGAERVDAEEVAREGVDLRRLTDMVIGGRVHVGDAEVWDMPSRRVAEERGTGEGREWPPEDSDEERERRLNIPSPGHLAPAAEGESDGHEFGIREPPVNLAEHEGQDEQGRLQHWLAGSGLHTLKTYLDAHPDVAAWSLPEGERLLDEYAEKLVCLRSSRMRDFLLRYSLPQGTNAKVRELIESRMQR